MGTVESDLCRYEAEQDAADAYANGLADHCTTGNILRVFKWMRQRGEVTDAMVDALIVTAVSVLEGNEYPTPAAYTDKTNDTTAQAAASLLYQALQDDFNEEIENRRTEAAIDRWESRGAA